MKLIPEWKRAWRMVSVQAMTIANASLAAWVALPERLQDSIPIGYVIAFACTMLVVGVVGRLVKQEKVSGDAA